MGSTAARSTGPSNEAQNPHSLDLGKGMMELVRSRGYPIEAHRVTTADGYILGAFRIPRGWNDSVDSQRRPPVLLQHALLDSSFAWVGNQRDQSLAYILADAGYDVWLGNNRGNRHSREHTVLSTTSAEYWDFSYDEMAQYDFPAVIDYVLQQSGAEKLAYIGHSQGSVQAFAGLSIQPKLADKVALFVAFAPVAFMRNQMGLWGGIAGHLGIGSWLHYFGHGGFMCYGDGDSMLNTRGPDLSKMLPSTSHSFLEWVCGPSEHIDRERTPVFVRWTPAGTSVKNMAHFEQALHAVAFQWYDYGSEAANELKYSQPTPPSFQLRNIRVPIAMYCGDSDYMTHPADLALLRDQLPEGVVVKYQVIPTYSHLDFTWAPDACQLVYPDMIDLLTHHLPAGAALKHLDDFLMPAPPELVDGVVAESLPAGLVLDASASTSSKIENALDPTYGEVGVGDVAAQSVPDGVVDGNESKNVRVPDGVVDGNESENARDAGDVA